MLKFPDLGSIRTVPLYPFPEPLVERSQWKAPPVAAGEDAETYDDYKAAHEALYQRAERHVDVKLEVKLVGASLAFQWGMATRQARLRDAQRWAKLREGTTKATAPELWGEGNLTADGSREYREALRSVLTEAFVKIHGVTVGDVDLVDLEPAESVKLLDAVALADEVARRCIDAQAPDVEQFLA